MGGALVLGGTVVSTAASLLKSDDREKDYYRSMAAAAQAQAKQTEENARRNAGYIFQDAAHQNNELSRNYSSLLGKQKTALAASGLGKGSATAQMILKNSRLNALMDQELLNDNMNRALYESNTQSSLQAMQYRAQASEYRAAERKRSNVWLRIGTAVGGLLR